MPKTESKLPRYLTARQIGEIIGQGYHATVRKLEQWRADKSFGEIKVLTMKNSGRGKIKTKYRESDIMRILDKSNDGLVI